MSSRKRKETENKKNHQKYLFLNKPFYGDLYLPYFPEQIKLVFSAY